MIPMHTLQRKREEWERGGQVVLAVTDHDYIGCDGHGNPQFYDTVYVVVQFEDEFSLHRYFPVMRGTDGERWEVSVDVQGDELTICLDELNRAFDKRYPQEA